MERLIQDMFNVGDEPVNDCLTQEEIDNLEIREADSESRCSVCLDNINEGDSEIELDCEHRFHVRCVHEWAKRRNSCPVCRRTIIDREDSPPPSQQQRLVLQAVVPLDVIIILRFWNNVRLDTTWPMSVRIIDIFDYISKLMFCNNLKNRLILKFLGENGMEFIFKSTESMMTLNKKIIECRYSPVYVMNVSYQL